MNPMTALQSALTNLNLPVVLALAAAFLSVIAAATAVRVLLHKPDLLQARLRVGGARSKAITTIESGPSPLLAKTSVNRQVAATPIGRTMLHAGITRAWAVQIFLTAKFVLALLLPLSFALLNRRLNLPIERSAIFAIGLALLGFMLPNMWLLTRVRKRQLLVERGLPDAMDLLVTCVEAGLGLDAALARVGQEIHISWPQLAVELKNTFLEIGAGVPRIDAFRRLAERTGVEDLRALAATLAQTELFGSSIATALRIRAEAMRTRRMQRAEERAAVVAVKMTVPLILCILPALIAVVMGPAVVRIITNVLPNLGPQ